MRELPFAYSFESRGCPYGRGASNPLDTRGTQCRLTFPPLMSNVMHPSLGESMPDENVNPIELAEAVIIEQLPSSTERNLVLERLVASAKTADRFAPNAWGVTLFLDGFRLNVGQVEAVVYAAGNFRVNLVGSVGSPPYQSPDFSAASYSSLPQPLCAFVGTVEQYALRRSAISASHDEFLRLAAHAPSGKPRRGSPFRRSHNEGLINYAIAQVERDHTA